MTSSKKPDNLVFDTETQKNDAAKATGFYCIDFRSPHSKKQEYDKADKVISSFQEIKFEKFMKLI